MSTRSLTPARPAPPVPVDASVRVRSHPSRRDLRDLGDSRSQRSQGSRGYASEPADWRAKSGRILRRALSPLDTLRETARRRRSRTPTPRGRRLRDASTSSSSDGGRRPPPRAPRGNHHHQPPLASILRNRGERLDYSGLSTDGDSRFSSCAPARASSVESGGESYRRRDHRRRGRSASPASSVGRGAPGIVSASERLNGPVQELAAACLFLLKDDHSDVAKRASRRVRRIAKLDDAAIFGHDAFGLEEEDAEAADEDDLPRFDRGVVNSKTEAVPPRVYALVQSQLRSNHPHPYSEVHEKKAHKLIPDIIRASNENGLSLRQIRLLANEFLEGKLKQGLRALRTAAKDERDALEEMRDVLHRPSTTENYDRQIREWKLQADKPIHDQLRGLQLLYIASSTQKSAPDIELLVREAALRGVPLPVKALMDHHERRYRRLHGNHVITMAWFARRLQKELDRHGKESKGRVRVVQEEAPPREDRYGQQDAAHLNARFDAVAGDLGALIRSKIESLEKRVKQASIQQLDTSGPPPTSGPPQSGGGPPRWRSGNSYTSGGSRNATGYQSGTPIAPNSEEFARATEVNSFYFFDSTNSSGDGSPTTHEWVGEYYRPLVQVPQLPQNCSTFVQRQGRDGPYYSINRDLLSFFRDRCCYCGISHRRGSKFCPYRQKAASWTVCTKCRMGLHAVCLIDPAYLNAVNSRGHPN